MLGGALWQSLDEIIRIDQNKLIDRIQRKMTQDYISTLAHLMLGKEIASSLTFPKKSMTGIALVGGSFAKNFVVTSVARVLPNGIDRLGKYKAKQRNEFMQQIIKNTQADLSYERG
jgi:hypothetical protein